MINQNNITNLMNQAQKMQKKISKIQKKISKIEVIGESGAGLVKITLNGKNNCKNIQLNKKLFKENDQEIIEDLIIAAFNDAIRKISEEKKKKMSLLSDKIPIPPGMNFPL
ncbi:YbaB/EbfC family nucleoid-associated protein [Buchnera aphidicola]|uniref:YbaB/EbfC family nucleoid-associated protein n=1 Tax=Buchnera aphidicola TaxID=9 RepID=UPI0030EBFDDC